MAIKNIIQKAEQEFPPVVNGTIGQNVVYATGNQTISGNKIFNNGLYFANSSSITHLTGNSYTPSGSTRNFFVFNGSGWGDYGGVRLYVGDSVFADSFIGYGGDTNQEPDPIIDLEEVRWEKSFFFGNTGIANESRIALGAYSDKNPSGYITSENVVTNLGGASGIQVMTTGNYNSITPLSGVVYILI
jgi:hypothetical protein